MLITEYEKRKTPRRDKSTGLFNGDVGDCLSLFIESLDNDKLKQRAEILLEHIADNVNQISSCNFEDGLAGLGFAIEWLAQNNFININTDEILEDIDDYLYKDVVFEKKSSIMLGDGLLGKGLFFYKRLQAKNPNQNRYRIICLNECLVLLSDELLNWFTNLEVGLLNKKILDFSSQEIITTAQSLIFFEKLFSSRLNTRSAERGIYIISSFLKRAFEDNEVYSQVNCIYLVHAYVNVAIKLNEKQWLNLARETYYRYLNAEHLENLNAQTNYINNYLSLIFKVDYKFKKTIGLSRLESALTSSLFKNEIAEIWLLN
ncbi:hypothetical protein ACS5PU_10460 [Pedobacter sp. GSP4]|uniref:hypothetical protein n=1 Tax=Pedobacter sp. GSP4 TaxID=3453716 RepID=UPI003EEB588A